MALLVLLVWCTPLEATEFIPFMHNYFGKKEFCGPLTGYTLYMRSARGLSLVETLVVIGILSIMAALTFETYVSVNANKALDTDAERIIAEIGHARSLTVGSKNDTEWGVHIASSSVTIFEGDTYTEGASGNTVAPLHSAVQISAISLRDGVTDIVFERLTGDTTATGTVTLSYVASSSVARTITIYGTGVADVQ